MSGESIFEQWISSGGYRKYKNATVFSEPQLNNIKKNTLIESLGNPLGTKSLKELLRGKKIEKALILVDDLSRPTPQKEILPVVLDIFLKEGIGKDKIMMLALIILILLFVFIFAGVYVPFAIGFVSAHFST